MNFKNSDLYRSKIHNLIPGGAHTYTKGDDQFPALAPAAIKKGKGAFVWDLDDNKFMDCSMGLGSVTIGHAYDEVDDYVCQTIRNGVNFQRPSYMEMQAAETFLGIVDYHEMIKFAKNGSTVTSAAVKLARAFTGKDLVAFPSDHPFYSYDDWFIGVKECNRGVPESIQKLSVTFKSNDLQSLKEMFDRNPGKIACVITEPEKFDGAHPEFLKQAVKLCHDNGALFIADEMVSGFKVGFPGSCKKHGVVPDLSTWGKGTANGFSFCALTGRRDVMELGGIKKKGAPKVFLISTTHGGETHSLAAVMKTIEIFRREKLVEANNKKGQFVIDEIRKSIAQQGLSDYITCTDSSWTLAFGFNDKSLLASQVARTYFMQEMISRGILFQGALVPTHSHSMDDLKFFISTFNEVMKKYAVGLEEGFEQLLVGEPCQPVFRKFI